MEGSRTGEQDGGGARSGAPVGARAKYLRPEAPDQPIVTMTRGELETMLERVAERVAARQAPLLVDKQGLASRLECSASHIDVLRKRGLPTVLVGQAVRFEPEAVVAWLRARGEEDSTDAVCVG